MAAFQQPEELLPQPSLASASLPNRDDGCDDDIDATVSTASGHDLVGLGSTTSSTVSDPTGKQHAAIDDSTLSAVARHVCRGHHKRALADAQATRPLQALQRLGARPTSNPMRCVPQNVVGWPRHVHVRVIHTPHAAALLEATSFAHLDGIVPHAGLALPLEYAPYSSTHMCLVEPAPAMSLAAALRDANNAALPHLLRWVSEAAEGLRALHRHGLRHGAVSFDSIMLYASEGDSGDKELITGLQQHNASAAGRAAPRFDALCARLAYLDTVQPLAPPAAADTQDDAGDTSRNETNGDTKSAATAAVARAELRHLARLLMAALAAPTPHDDVIATKDSAACCCPPSPLVPLCLLPPHGWALLHGLWSGDWPPCSTQPPWTAASAFVYARAALQSIESRMLSPANPALADAVACLASLVWGRNAQHDDDHSSVSGSLAAELAALFPPQQHPPPPPVALQALLVTHLARDVVPSGTNGGFPCAQAQRAVVALQTAPPATPADLRLSSVRLVALQAMASAVAAHIALAAGAADADVASQLLLAACTSTNSSPSSLGGAASTQGAACAPCGAAAPSRITLPPWDAVAPTLVANGDGAPTVLLSLGGGLRADHYAPGSPYWGAAWAAALARAAGVPVHRVVAAMHAFVQHPHTRRVLVGCRAMRATGSMAVDLWRLLAAHDADAEVVRQRLFVALTNAINGAAGTRIELRIATPAEALMPSRFPHAMIRGCLVGVLDAHPDLFATRAPLTDARIAAAPTEGRLPFPCTMAMAHRQQLYSDSRPRLAVIDALAEPHDAETAPPIALHSDDDGAPVDLRDAPVEAALIDVLRTCGAFRTDPIRLVDLPPDGAASRSFAFLQLIEVPREGAAASEDPQPIAVCDTCWTSTVQHAYRAAAYGHAACAVGVSQRLLASGATQYTYLTELWQAANAAADNGHTVALRALFNLMLEYARRSSETVAGADGVTLPPLPATPNNPLHFASTEDTMRVCLAYMVKLVNRPGTRQRTALMLAARKGLAPIVAQLLDAKADRWLADDRGLNALSLAAMHQHSDVMAVLLRDAPGRAPTFINHADAAGKTPLFHAVAQREPKVHDVTLLLEAGADVDAAGRPSPIHEALVRDATTDVLAPLLRVGLRAAPAVQDSVRRRLPRALTLAVRSGNAAAVALLLKHGADPYGGAQPCAVVEAARLGHAQILDKCLDQRCAAASRTANITASLSASLFCATRHGHEACAAMLVARGAVADASFMSSAVAAELERGVRTYTSDGASATDETDDDARTTATVAHSMDDSRRDDHHRPAARGRVTVAALNAALNASSDGLSPLAVAAEHGEIDTVQALLRVQHADPNAIVNGWTALHAACKAGHANVVRALLAAHADVALRVNKYTPLMTAVVKQRAGCVRELLLGATSPRCSTADVVEAFRLAARLGADGCIAELALNAQEHLSADDCEAALFVALERGHGAAAGELLRTLVAASGYCATGRHATRRRKRATTLLPGVVETGSLSCVVTLVEELDADVRHVDASQSTSAAIAAAALASRDVLLYLLSRDAVTRVGRWTALMAAAERDAAHNIDVLLASDRTLLNSTSPDGCTALMLACRRGCADAARALLAYDSVAVNPTNAGASPRWSALQLAALHCPRVVQQLVEAGAATAGRDPTGDTPLHAAVRNRHHRAIAALVTARDANFDAAGLGGRTALHAAAFADDATAVGLLVRAGAAINARDAEGRTPAFVAARCACCCALRALFQLGCAQGTPGVNAAEAEAGTAPSDRQEATTATSDREAAGQGTAARSARTGPGEALPINAIIAHGDTLLHAAIRSGSTLAVALCTAHPAADVTARTAGGGGHIHTRDDTGEQYTERDSVDAVALAAALHGAAKITSVDMEDALHRAAALPAMHAMLDAMVDEAERRGAADPPAGNAPPQYMGGSLAAAKERFGGTCSVM